MKILAVSLTILSAFLAYTGSASGQPKADQVLVVKSESRLYLIKEGDVFASFPVSFGGDPKGHKQERGDGRTPEGCYVLDYKNPNSSFYKSIHVSYPNAQDRRTAQKRGAEPGGDIMVHGQPNRWGWVSPVLQLFNWTNGCIALSNTNMDHVWDAVDVRTPIEIRP
jgi:murein L,D-transpeptidase YafK